RPVTVKRGYASMGSPSSLGEESPDTLEKDVARTVRFNGVAEFTRRRVALRPDLVMDRNRLQWGRRVHSAKREASNLSQESTLKLQWGRRVHSAKRPYRNGDCKLRAGFNGVAEFTRRRARPRRISFPGYRLASMGSPSSLGEEHSSARFLVRLGFASMVSPSSLGEAWHKACIKAASLARHSMGSPSP